MKITLKLITIFSIIFFLLPYAFAADRIFYEDYEQTSFSEHFLEDYWGTSYAEWWDEFKREIDQSSISHNGSYSLVTNPPLVGNPRGSIGGGDKAYGNLSNFDLADYTNRYWYFRWYQRWENSSYTMLNKIFYLGGGGDYFYIAKTGSHSFIVCVSDEYGGPHIAGGDEGCSQNLDDENWHKMEIYFDVGTSGNSNGEVWFKIDDEEVFHYTNLAFKSQDHPAQGTLGLPANTSGTVTGSQQVWYDDLEIWTINGPDDLPPAGDPVTTVEELTPPSNLTIGQAN